MDLQALRTICKSRRPALQPSGSEYAVLVPVIERDRQLCLLYEVRSAALRHQPGEVCFPGGRIESGEAPLACAVRETREELGVSAEQIDIFGPLDFHLRGSSIVYPFLASLRVDEPSRLPINPAEVSTLFTVPLSWLEAHPPELYRCSIRPHPQDFPYEAVGVSPDYPWAPVEMSVPIYHGLPYPLWGLTARITDGLIRQLHREKKA